MQRIIELDGKKYIWNGIHWLDEGRLKPPETIVRKLNARSSLYFAQEDELIADVDALVSRAKKARDNLQHLRAEKLAHQILKIEPANDSGLAADFGEVGHRSRSKPAAFSEQIGHPLVTWGWWSNAESKPV